MTETPAPDDSRLPAAAPERRLTAAQFQGLTAVPAELEWFANLDNAHTRKAYRADIVDFRTFAGIAQPEEFRQVTRAHVIAWRGALEGRNLSGATIRRKLAALSDAHARQLLDAPPADTLKGRRDRAILSVLLFHALRREELTKLRVKDLPHLRGGVPHVRVQGKGGKLRYVPAHPHTMRVVAEYLEAAGHGADQDGPLFRPLRNARAGHTRTALTPGAVHGQVVGLYMKRLGLVGELMGPHALRATAATNALEHQADIAKVQEWLGHASIATTRIYDRRGSRPEESPTYRIAY